MMRLTNYAVVRFPVGMKPRFAVAGLRHDHALQLARTLKHRQDLSLVAVCEEDDSAIKVAEASGVTITHRRLDALFSDADDFDILLVGDYYARRGSIVIRGLLNGKHVISDKPFCTDPEELNQIETLVRQEDAPVIGCQLGNRYNGSLRTMRRLVREGLIGVPHTVTFLAHHPLLYGTRPDWYFEPGKHGGTVNDIAIHAFDVLPWLLDRSPRRLVAGRTWNQLLPKHPDFQVCGQLMFVLEGGVGVMGDVSYLSPDAQGYSVPQYWRFTIHGEHGMIEGGPTRPTVNYWPANADGPERIAAEPSNADGYLDDFLAEIRGEHPATLSKEDVLRAGRWALTVQGAIDAGRTDVSLVL